MGIFDQIGSCGRNATLTGYVVKPFVEAWQFNYELVESPAIEPVTLAEAKLFARIDVNDDDDLVNSLITAARKTVEDLTGRALINQTWTAWLDNLPCSRILNLGKGRIDSVTSIKAYAEDGSTETLDSSYYEIDNDSARIGLLGSVVWPIGTRGFMTFAVEYVAGYGSATTDAPDWAKTVVKQLVSHWYEYREASTAESQNQVPMSTRMILESNKVSRT